LIIKGIDFDKKSIDHPVTLMDIPPTILNILNIDHSILSNNGNLFNKKRDFIISEGFKPSDFINESKIDLDKINYSCYMNEWHFIMKSIENKIELYNLNDTRKNLDDLSKDKHELTSIFEEIIEKHKQRIKNTQFIINNIKKTLYKIGRVN
jgi:arylsulfatase A-like enzyme